MNNLAILHADALDHMRSLSSQSVDLVIADPPYNLGKDYGNNSDSREADDYLAFSELWIREACRLLTDSGTVYVFMGVRFISYIYQILERTMGLNFNSWICWHYTQGLGKRRGYSPRHDDILMFTKSQKYTFNLDAVRVP